jgi:hypothetical protein
MEVNTMLYYKVKPENDNKRRYKFHRGGGLEIDGIFVGNELYTPKEINKYPGGVLLCDPVNVSKKQVYFFFGARFSNQTGGVALPF